MNNFIWKEKKNKNLKNFNRITIAYLSWKRHNVLEQTLKSHEDNGLFNLINNKTVLFQEVSDLDIKIAEKYNLKYIGENKNIGILDALLKLIENCKTEYFIFSENDWLLIHPPETVEKMLTDCINILSENEAEIIRLRSKRYPGLPYSSSSIWIKNDNANINIDNFPWKAESLSWVPHTVYKEGTFKTLDKNFKWHITTLEHNQWSNNIFIAKTSFLKDTLLPLINKTRHFTSLSDNPYSGLEDVLANPTKFKGTDSELDIIINNFKNTKIASGEGLFTHKDFV